VFTGTSVWPEFCWNLITSR